MRSSGGPSVAVLVRVTSTTAPLPDFVRVRFVPSDGGPGGDGGAGGDGGQGAPGAIGGSIPLAQRTTPTLAGPFPGARGGTGGDGGSGGGGGGGCGGPSVGIWVSGRGTSAPSDVARWRSTNTFALRGGGAVGRGGGGGAPGGDGAGGGAIDVVVR